MILTQEKTKCETNMTGKTAFTICATAKMFKILSSGLYSNKEKAIIREVSCNAYDANIDAGNGDIPIVVHLPNKLEPFLSIKDTGTGLSPDQMVSIYTQYGNSTKTDRNDQIGALGLGSKSPFSYIDSFTVISIQDNLKSTYSCYIDGNGEPQLQPFSSEDTKECNGVEVTFPVKHEDFGTFRKEAEIVFRAFEVKPTITGNSEYKESKFEVLVSSDDEENPEWQLIQPEYTGYRYGTKIQVLVQGNIEYPLNFNKVSDLLSDRASRLHSENFRLHFPIGELDISASREELGYDKVTIDNIVQKMENMILTIDARQNAEMQKCKTLFEARQFISDIKYSSSLYRETKFVYNNKPIDNEIELSTGLVKYYRANYRSIRRKEFFREDTITIHKSKEDVIYVFDDVGKKGAAVTKARSLVTGTDVVVYLIKDKSVLDVLGNPEHTLTSDIIIEKTKKNLTNSSGEFYKKLQSNSSENWQWNGSFYSADNLEIDLDKKFYYVKVNGKYSYSNRNIVTMKLAMVTLGYMKDSDLIYGVKYGHSSTKKFKLTEGIDFEELVLQKMKRSIKLKRELKRLPDFYTQQAIRNVSYDLRKLINNTPYNNTPFFKKLKDIQDDTAQNFQGMKSFIYVAKELEFKLPKNEVDIDSQIVEKYPLLYGLSYGVPEKGITDYIEMIDSRDAASLLQEENEEETRI